MPQIKQCTLFSKLKDKHNLFGNCLVWGLLRLRDKFKDKGITCPRNIAANNCEMPDTTFLNWEEETKVSCRPGKMEAPFDLS